MAATRKKKSAIKVQKYVWKPSKPVRPVLKINQSLESVVNPTVPVANLVQTLVKAELMRRNAYNRWSFYLDEIGLRLHDLIVYLEVLHDDTMLIKSLKAFSWKMRLDFYKDKFSLQNDAMELRNLLTEKISDTKMHFQFSK